MPKKKDSPGRTRALSAYVKLLRASETVHSQAVQPLAEHGLTPSQFGVLEALYHLGPLCLRDLAQKILKTSGNLTMVVDNLEKRGLAHRIKGEVDRRYITVELTAAGRKLIARIFPAHVSGIREIMSRLTKKEQEQLAALCKKLGRGEMGH